MPSLIEQAMAVRESARAAGDADAAHQTLRRAAGIATELGAAAQRIKDAAGARKAMAAAHIPGAGRPIAGAPTRKLATKGGEELAASVGDFVISSTVRDLTRASEQLADTAEKTVSDAWEKWTQEQLQGVGTAAQVLERALSRGPFAATIETAGAARKQLQVLGQRDLPTDSDVKAFTKQRAALEAASAKIEQEVPKEYRATLVDCALPQGTRLTELPDGFIDWVRDRKAAAYFKVSISD
jgi:hypothetical protein